MDILTLILMLIAAGVMVFGLQKSKQGVEWGKPVTIIGAVVALLLAVSSLFTGGGADPEKIREISQRYREVCGIKLGQYLSAQFDGQSAAFLMPYQPIDMDDPHQDIFMKALRKELENNGLDVTGQMSPEPPPEVKEREAEMREQVEQMRGQQGSDTLPPEEMMYGFEPMYTWFTGSELDQLIRSYDKECDLLVAISELPMDVFAANFWRSPDAPKVVLTRGSVYEYYGAIKAGAVVAAIAHHPDATYEQEKPPKDIDAAFAQRYLLITPDNVDEVASKYPNLFEKTDG